MPAEIAERARSREALQAEVGFPPPPHIPDRPISQIVRLGVPNGNVEMSTTIE